VGVALLVVLDTLAPGERLAFVLHAIFDLSDQSAARPVDSQHLVAVACPHMSADKREVLYGTLGLMILKTLEALGPLHGYRLARRVEQISGHQLALNQGTLYPALVKLEHGGWVASEWGESESGRRVKIYRLTKAGRTQLRAEEDAWQKATGTVARFFRIRDSAL
jgi:PadR family transcriptional regulator PadR